MSKQKGRGVHNKGENSCVCVCVCVFWVVRQEGAGTIVANVSKGFQAPQINRRRPFSLF